MNKPPVDNLDEIINQLSTLGQPNLNFSNKADPITLLIEAVKEIAHRLECHQDEFEAMYNNNTK